MPRIFRRPRKKPEVTLPVEPGFDKIGPKIGAGRRLTPTEWRTRGMRAKKGPLPAPKPAPPKKTPQLLKEGWKGLPKKFPERILRRHTSR